MTSTENTPHAGKRYASRTHYSVGFAVHAGWLHPKRAGILRLDGVVVLYKHSSFSSRALDTQDQTALLSHDTAVAVHIADGGILELPFSAASHELACPFDDVTHATGETGLPKR